MAYAPLLSFYVGLRGVVDMYMERRVNEFVRAPDHVHDLDGPCHSGSRNLTDAHIPLWRAYIRSLDSTSPTLPMVP